VKKRLVFTVLATFLVVLVLIVSACAQGGATPSTTHSTGGAPVASGQHEIFKVLNPAGVYIPVDCKPNAPRIDSLAGKKVLYYESEATNILMPTLLEKLKKDYPTATFDVIHTESFGEFTPTPDQLKHEAVIRGVGW